MGVIVLDSSAVVHIVQGTEEGRALEGLILENERIVSPTMIYSEAANALWKYVNAGVMSEQAAEGYYESVLGLIDEFVDVEDLTLEALREAARLSHPVYDMLYFVLTRRLGAILFTTDRKLQRLCAENGVNCIETIAFPRG